MSDELQSLSAGDSLSNTEPTITQPAWSKPTGGESVPANIAYNGGGTAQTDVPTGQVYSAGATSNTEPTITQPAYEAQTVPQPEIVEPDDEAVLPCINAVKAGDTVQIELRNGEATVIGAVGSGDKMEQKIDNMEGIVADVETVVSDIGNHFWTDEHGAYVTEEEHDASTGSAVHIGAAGVEVLKNGESVGAFTGGTVRLGNADDPHIIVDNDDILFKDGDKQVLRISERSNGAGLNYCDIRTSDNSLTIGTEDAQHGGAVDNLNISEHVVEARSINGLAYSTAAVISDPNDPCIYINSVKNTTTPGRIWNDTPNTLLWSGALYMHNTQTINLPHPISQALTGIVLVFSPFVNGAAQNWGFTSFFVPKSFVAKHPNASNMFTMIGSNTTDFRYGIKLLYINNNTITGHANNTSTGTGSQSNIKFTNNYFVLRYVYAV